MLSQSPTVSPPPRPQLHSPAPGSAELHRESYSLPSCQAWPRQAGWARGTVLPVWGSPG